VRADTLTLKTLFQKNVRYVVPTFQRPYVWNQEDQWKPLWDDVRNTAERYLDQLDAVEGNRVVAAERSPSHFMGAVVLQQQPTVAAELEVRHVIDGQQRRGAVRRRWTSVDPEPRCSHVRPRVQGPGVRPPASCGLLIGPQV